MTTNISQLFYCKYCDSSWKRKCDLDRHNTTAKHIKCHQEFQNKAEIVHTKGSKVKTVYFCDYCYFNTNKKKQLDKHVKSKEHIKNENKEENILEINKHYLCCKCEKKYDNYKSCWDHSKKCNVIEKLIELQIKNEKIFNIYSGIEYPRASCQDRYIHHCRIKPIIEVNKKSKRKTIPLALRRNVWNKYIGEEIGKTLCLCCKLTDISQMTFSCGHIVSVYNGGDINLENLKPICVSCNSSMGTQNMDEFIQNYKL